MTSTTTHTARRPNGPNAGILAVVATALTVAGIAISAAIAQEVIHKSNSNITPVLSRYSPGRFC